jgi:hypothetical protein
MLHPDGHKRGGYTDMKRLFNMPYFEVSPTNNTLIFCDLIFATAIVTLLYPPLLICVLVLPYQGIQWDRLGHGDGTPVPSDVHCSVRASTVFEEAHLEPHSSLLFQQF